jgi:regulator of protease activity HflC (stomatin/prohibitin superfamily)
LLLLFLAAFTLVALLSTGRLDDQAAMSPRANQIFGALIILLAFPLLVLGRFYANVSPRLLPEAPQVARLLRVPLTSFVVCGIASLLLSVGFQWALVVEKAIGLLIGLVSIELILRVLAIAFVPFDGRRSLADSTIAGWLRLTPPSIASVGKAVRHQFGIDLSRSWALAFVRRATLPVVFGMVVFAWCLTGVTALGLNERAVYERFGVPVAVFGPGLHIHWPWPFGIMRDVELGVVHEIPIVFSDAGAPRDAIEKPSQIKEGDAIEGPAPSSADRLWNEAHPSEASYLVASEAQGKQSFQIVNVDLRVVYRVGLTDDAAKEAAYAVSDPEALVRAIAGKLLARYFARYTLLDVLGQSREQVTNDFRAELQSELQAMSTGIEIIAIVVEAIHPPAAAANAYHAVQAAGINAQSQISLQRATAIGTMSSAQQTITQGLDDATAGAAELVAQAQTKSILFEGDRQAYRQDGQVFLFERWLDRLSNDLPKSSYIIVDHRLKGIAAPTFDFRTFGLPSATYEYPPQTPSTRRPPSSPSSSSSPSSPSGNGDDEGGDDD